MRTVLITGGSRGIGLAIANKFKKEGYHVITPTRHELDLLDIKSVKHFVEEHKNTFFDCIINNAGINEINNIDKITDEELTDTLQINLISPIMLLRGLTGKMKENQYGRIINIASIWAVVSKPGRCAYSASKNGLHGVTNTLALELAPYNILVNTVCPGFTLTELTKKNNSPEEMKQMESMVPLGRLAQPVEIAEVVYFLGSESNTYLTGQKINVDGGFCEQ